MEKRLTYKQKLSILKSVGAAKEMAGRGIYFYSLNSKRVMMNVAKTWEETVKYCESRNWYAKWEQPVPTVKIHM